MIRIPAYTWETYPTAACYQFYLYELIIVRKLQNNPRNGVVRIEELIRRKAHGCQKADRQLCTGINVPSGSCHSAQQLVQVALASESFYVLYICMLSNLQVLRCHKLHNLPIAHNISRTVALMPLSEVNIKHQIARS